jgi:hypothetical protein
MFPLRAGHMRALSQGELHTIAVEICAKIPKLRNAFHGDLGHGLAAGHAVVAGLDSSLANEMPSGGAVLWEISLAVGEAFQRSRMSDKQRVFSAEADAAGVQWMTGGVILTGGFLIFRGKSAT